MSRTDYWKQFSNQYKAAFPSLTPEQISSRVDFYRRLDIDVASLVNSRFAITVDRFIDENRRLINLSSQNIQTLNTYSRTIQASLKDGDRQKAINVIFSLFGSISIVDYQGNVIPLQITPVVATSIIEKLFYYEQEVSRELLQDMFIYCRICLLICRDMNEESTDQRLKSIYEGIITEKEKSSKTFNFNDRVKDIYSNAMKYVGQIYPQVSRLFC